MPVEIGALVGYVGGIASKLLYDEIARIRKQRRQEKQAKIEWYENLITLAKEIRISVPKHKSTVEYFDSVDITEGSNPLMSDDEYEFLEEELGGYEGDIEQLVQKVGEQKVMEHIQEVNAEIKSKMRIYEERLQQHLAESPEETEEELLNVAARLLRDLTTLRMIGQIPEGVEDDIESTAEDLVAQCSEAISGLETDKREKLSSALTKIR